jgi:hypothetical protein
MPKLELNAIRPLYAFLDPHGGKAGPIKRLASQTAIAIGGTDGRHYFILDCVGGRWHTNEIVDTLYALTQRWTLKSIGAEANGLLNLWYDTLLREAKEKGKHLPLVPVPQVTTKEKDDRIRDRLQPLSRQGKLLLRNGLDVLKKQIQDFPQSPQKDYIDATASLVAFIPPKTLPKERAQMDAEKLEYLKRCGKRPEEIRRLMLLG